jgi:hypothetical protein
MSKESFEFRPSGIIEFEEVDPASIAKPQAAKVDEALDIDPLSINFGRRKDCRPTAAERMLAGTTIDWLLAFPAESRPKALCDRFPHVANRLAQGWLQATDSMHSLQLLAGDARWGGAGFPAQVQAEVQRLLSLLDGARQKK